MSCQRPPTNKHEDELKQTAKALVAPEKGILAADESTGTIGKRLADINVENTLENRRRYRKALFSTEKLSDNISGVILFEETLLDEELSALLDARGVLKGIKVDQGTRPLPLRSTELFTQGLAGLAERCQKYYELGCRFAKWRAVLRIEGKNVDAQAVEENAHSLARYAATCQANGLVPIVEPEILMDGDHCVGVCRRAVEHVLSAVFKKLMDNKVLLEGMLLKVNMCLPGSEYKCERNMATNALATVTALRRTLPVAVPGVTFLSGGQSEEEATLHLNEINKLGPHPWALSFSFGRALQRSALKAWGGKDANVAKMQAVLLARAKANGQAAEGKYAGDAAGSKESLHVKGYAY